jgi:uncharacterized membrane protein (UPF0127 family)
LAVAGILVSCETSDEIPSAESDTVCFEETCLSVDLAESSAEKEQGLMGVASLADNQGMLFVYEEGNVRSFWMYQMLIEIDIIWISEESVVLGMEESLPICSALPCESYVSPDRVQYVLEVAAGQVDELGIAVGDEVEMEIRTALCAPYLRIKI